MDNKNKILVLFTGGTICTMVKDGKISIDPDATAALTDFFEKSDSDFVPQVSFKKGKMMGILSENMTIEKWNEIAKEFLDLLPRISECKGIIVAHGTDTLAYSTAMFSLLLTGITVPVIFVSSNYSIINPDGSENKKANGNANFRAATECICQDIAPGVYATYKNPKDGKMYLHNGAHLEQCRIYDDNFYSADALDITDYSKVDFQNPFGIEGRPSGKMPILKLTDNPLKNCVLKITPYVGTNYDAYNYNAFKAVLHGTYHSGTACVEKTETCENYGASSILYMIDKCSECGTDVYYSPSRIEPGYAVYDTVPLIKEHICGGKRAAIYYGMTDEMMYAKLVFAYSVDTDEVKGEIFGNLNDEYIIR